MTTQKNNPEHEERLRRWRLVLGGHVERSLNQSDSLIDFALGQLYGMSRSGKSMGRGGKEQKSSRGGLNASQMDVGRWLGDIREYFPASAVQIMQDDLIEKVGLRQLLTQPEILEQITPDVQLVSLLIGLKDSIPDETKSTARIVVRKVVEALLAQLEEPMRTAIQGALNRAERKFNPRLRDINWDRTIRTNLKHYQPDYQTIIPEVLIGYGKRKRMNQHHIIIAIDQSGSMASSVVYSSIFAAVMASIPALKVSMIAFDTSVIDLTEDLDDPVDLLFGVQLGGGTDINQAVAYCQQLITNPNDTILVLISDLIEGGDLSEMLERCRAIVDNGVQLIALLALTDQGTPSFSEPIAQSMAGLGAISFGCTPDLFPDLMANALNRRDLTQWAIQNEVKLVMPKDKT